VRRELEEPAHGDQTLLIVRGRLVALLEQGARVDLTAEQRLAHARQLVRSPDAASGLAAQQRGRVAFAQEREPPGELDARHAAWIQSSLQNLACYFEYAGIVHNDIGAATYFVSPRNHTGCLLGGWWYACAAGHRLKALPPRTVRYAPPDVIRRKKADPRVDLELVRATGREILGDPAGARLRRNKKIPAAFANWVNGATSGEAVTDYKLWNYALETSFGKRRFVEMKIETSDLYQ